MRRLAVLAIASLAMLGACKSDPATVAEVHESHDWGNEKGADLGADFQRQIKRILSGKQRDASLTMIRDARYECTFGEGHEDYPEPAAVCTRSFATRACQMDWEIMITSDQKTHKVDEVDATFTRDCVGTEDDWPEAKKSPIDDQLAPAITPTP